MNNLTELFTDIANAIREKTGTTDLIKATDFPEQIRSNVGNVQYTELKYIQSTGEQYIHIGIVPTNHKLEIKFQSTSNDSNLTLFGCESTTYHLTWYANKWYYACGNGETYIEQSTQCTELQTLIFNNDNNKLEFNGIEYGSTNTSVAARSKLTLFGRTAGGSLNARAKLYYCKIWDKSTNELVRNLIPVLDKKGEACLYDKVTETFFYNCGSGEFMGQLLLPKNTELNYIETTGGQYIDTGINCDYTKKIVLDFSIIDASSDKRILYPGSPSGITGLSYFIAGTYSNRFRFVMSNGYNPVFKNFDTNRHILEISKNMVFDGETIITNSVEYNANHNWYIFWNGDGATPTGTKIYGCKVYDNDVLVRDFVPHTDAEGEICLYDKVTQRFFYNSGYGDFIAGGVKE